VAADGGPSRTGGLSLDAGRVSASWARGVLLLPDAANATSGICRALAEATTEMQKIAVNPMAWGARSRWRWATCVWRWRRTGRLDEGAP
jgi:hypothetical protein